MFRVYGVTAEEYIGNIKILQLQYTTDLTQLTLHVED
jgi:hypothetical protein